MFMSNALGSRRRVPHDSAGMFVMLQRTVSIGDAIAAVRSSIVSVGLKGQLLRLLVPFPCSF